MVIDPKAFFEEADRLMTQGIEVSPERVKISSRAHLILPYHRALDHTSEERLGNEKVGTTLRGIGPAYEDKAGRRGIRTADALVPEVLRSRIERNLEDANRIIEAYGGEKLDAEQIFDEMLGLTERLGAFIGDTTHYLNVAAKEGRSILSRARRQLFSTSIMEPIHSSLRRTLSRAEPSLAPVWRRIV